MSYSHDFYHHRTMTPSSSPSHDGRMAFRTRPRRLMLLLFAAVFLTIVLFSRHEPTRTYGASLVFAPQAPPHDVASLARQHPVVFALIMYSEASAMEGAILLKSAVMYTSRPLHFHIVCDDAAIAYLEPRLRLLTHPIHPITVRFYRLTFQSMMDRIAREGTLDTGHSAGTPGLMKLFMHEVLPDDVEKAIYVDTDAFFLTDPVLLWEEFSRWGPDVAVSIPYHPNLPEPRWYNASKICSCIMLLDLQKFRFVRLMDSSIYRGDRSGLYPPAFAPPLFEELFGTPGPYHAELGDQSFWWAIVSNRQDIFHPLPYDWEVTSCLLDMYMTGLGSDGATEEEERKAMIHLEDTSYEGSVVLPKLLHFNCLHGTPVYYNWSDWSNPESGLAKRWKPAVDYHVGFKWLWLNRGHTESPVDIQVIIDPLFADQRFAAEHPNAAV